MNNSSGARTTFWSGRSEFESAVSDIFTISLTFTISLSKIVIPPPLLPIKLFWYQKFYGKQEGSPTKFFGPVRQNFFGQNRDAPFLCMKNFDTRNFLKHLRVPPRNFSALWDKKFLTEISDIPFLSIKFLDTRNFLKHWRVAQEIFRHRETKNFRQEKRDTPPSPSYP